MARRQINHPGFATCSTEQERWSIEKQTRVPNRQVIHLQRDWAVRIPTVKFGDHEFKVALWKPPGFVPGSPWFNSLPVLVHNQLACFAPVGTLNLLSQELMRRIMQLHYIPVMAFSLTDLLQEQISLEWDSRGSTMTNHKKLNDVTASLDRNCVAFTKEKVY